MINVKQIDNDDKEMWDAYVSASDQATPYHRFAWGQAVKMSYDFEILYFGAFIQNKLVGVMPFVRMGMPFKKTSLVSMPYCDGAGAIGDTPEIAEALINFSTTELAKSTQETIDLRHAKTTTVLPETLADGQKVRMLLNLAASPDEQMANFKSKLRSQIKKAEKNGLTAKVVAYSGADSFTKNVDELYDVISQNMHSLGSPVHSKTWFLYVLREYASNAYMVLVYKDETAVGGGIVLLNNNTASIPWASTKAEFNRLAPNMLLYWTVLSEAISQGASVFDFGRSTVNGGTYNFKKQWGSQPAPLHWASYENGHLIEVLENGKSKIRKSVEAIWRKLPLAVVNYMGPRIRKYVSM